VIFVHGLGSSKESPRNAIIASRLLERGIATLLFDLSGHGESSSDRSDGLAGFVADLETVFAWAGQQGEVDGKCIGISGSSLGGTIAVEALTQGKISPRTMVLRAPPIEAEEFEKISVPSLVLVGSLDPLLAGVELGVAGCPDLALDIVPGASHLFEEPGTLEEATRLTVEWFISELRNLRAAA
jgi:pimeloyl-ACP methyl ester carboxylesterase